MIYFIAESPRGPIKIGRSDDPQARIKTLQAGNARSLALAVVIPGERSAEQRLHERFAVGRLHGEWFARDTPGLSRFVSAARHFEGFWPEDSDSPQMREVLEVLHPDPEHQKALIRAAQTVVEVEIAAGTPGFGGVE